MEKGVKLKSDLFIDNCMGLMREYKYLLNFTSDNTEESILTDEIIKLKYCVNLRNVQLGGKPVFEFSEKEISRLLDMADELDGTSIYEVYCSSKYICKQAQRAQHKGRELEIGKHDMKVAYEV